MPVIVLAGEEEFEISRKVDALKAKLVDPAWASFNFQRIENPDLKSVIDSAAVVPFGPGNKVILFDRCELFTKKKTRGGDTDSDTKKSATDKLVKDLESALDMVAPNTFLIFACTANFDKTLKVSKAFEKRAQIEEYKKKKYFAGSDNSELISWGNKEAKHFGATIDDDAISYLAESTEVNLRQMSSEIEKAAIYIMPQTHIRLDHVMLLSPHFSHVFALLEHWALGHKQKVLESIQELQSRQVSAHMTLAAVQTTLSKWIHYRTEMDKAIGHAPGGRDVSRHDVPVKELARRIAFYPGTSWMVEQDLKRIKGLTLKFLVDKKKQAVELELAMKSGLVPEEHVLHLFFAA